MAKNHKEKDVENMSGVMMEIPKLGNKCLIRILENYLSKLNPLNNKFWQRAKNSFN